MAVDGRLNFDTKIDTKGFSKGVNSLGGQMSSLIGLAGKLAVALGAAFSVKEIIESAAEVKAAQSQFEQTFGEIQSQAETMINGVAKSSGILETRLKGVGTSIYAFAKTTGMDSASALNLMNDALQVTADSAAYYDRSLEDTAESLKSFLKGNFENDAALGLSCTETTRNAAANKLYGKSFTELSEAQKQMTLLQMVKDANALSGAMGQAARESDGWENVTGNLKEAWNQLLAAVGQPVLAAAVPIVQNITAAIEKLTEVAKSASGALADVLGIDLGQTADSAQQTAQAAAETAENYEDTAKSAEETTEQQENQLAGFDKINKLDDGTEKSSDKSGSAVSSPITALSGGAAVMPLDIETSAAVKKLKALIRNVKETFKAAANYIKKNFGGIFENIFDGLAGEGAELAGTFSRVFADIRTLADPLKNYFANDYTPYLQTVFSTLGNIAVGLLDTYNTVFSDIWDLAVFPILSNFISVGLPIITQFQTQVWETIGVLFASIKEIFDTLWNEAIAPVLGFISQLWCDTWQTISDFWAEWGQPIFDGINNAIISTKDIFLDIWEKILRPVFDNIMEVVDRIWTEHLQPLIAEFLDFVGELVTGAASIYNEFIAPIIKWLVDKLGPVVSKTVNTIAKTVGAVVGNIIDHVKGIITQLKGVVEFLTGIFTGNWSKAWQGIKDIFKGIWDQFVSIVKIPINLIIGVINKFTGAVESALNWIIDGINSISIDIPDAVADVVGFDSIGFDLSNIDIPDIPYLATGTVVPANYGQFLAVLGDNKREAEIVSPLSTMKQAVLEALVAYGGTGGNGQKMSLTIPITLNGRTISQIVIDDINEYIRRNGRSPIKA